MMYYAKFKHGKNLIYLSVLIHFLILIPDIGKKIFIKGGEFSYI